jgi:peptidoglycan/LPS O-acetylase OafA/YrhL
MKKPGRENKRYREDIQVLRGLAVVAVVLFHSSEKYFPLGYLGVDVFFVISGFVITPLIVRVFYSNGAEIYQPLANLREFFISRFYRLAPAFAGTIVVSSILVFLFLPVSEHSKFAKQGIASLFLLGNFGAFKYSGDYFSPNPSALLHTWSLSVEEQIYLFIPIILFLIIRKKSNVNKIVFNVFIALTIISFISFLFPALMYPVYFKLGLVYDSPFNFYSPVDRIWEFTIGGLGFFISGRYQKRLSSAPLILKSTLILILFLILFVPTVFHQNGSIVLITLLTLVIIIFRAFSIIPKQIEIIFQWLGDRSYSIYLVHMPLLCIAKSSPLTKFEFSDSRASQSVIAAIAAIFLGAASFSRIENRFRRNDRYQIENLPNIEVSLIYTLIIPLIFLALLQVGFETSYLGLEKRISVPLYAGFADPKCERDSLSGPPCVYGNTEANKTVLLIGDSHAGAISQAVVDAARNSKWNAVIWTHSGCHIQFEQSGSKNLTDACLNMNNKMRTWVEINKPEAVIVSQYMHLESSQSGVQNALIVLKEMVPNVLVVQNIPIFPDGANFMARNPLFMGKYLPPFSFKKTQMYSRDRNSSNILANWARKNGFTTVDFESLFCDNLVCSRYRDNGWLYRDAEHLSIKGASLTIPKLENFLRISSNNEH